MVLLVRGKPAAWPEPLPLLLASMSARQSTWIGELVVDASGAQAETPATVLNMPKTELVYRPAVSSAVVELTQRFTDAGNQLLVSTAGGRTGLPEAQ